MKLNKNKIEQALIKYGCSNRRSRELAIKLIGEDLFEEERSEVINEDLRSDYLVKNINEVEEE